MDTILKAGLISDDPVFAAVLSSCFSEERTYFPVFSLPRMTRPDWEFEINKRVTSINRVDLDILFCKPEDYATLAPLRDHINTDLVVIESYQDITKYFTHRFPNSSIKVSRENYLSGFIKAKDEKRILEINKANPSHLPLQNIIHPKSDTIVVLERTNKTTDISAINYSFAKGYDLLSFEQIPESVVKKIKRLFTSLNCDEASWEQIYQRLYKICQEYVDFEWIEENYKQAQFVVSEIPVGIFIESIPVAHLSHLQSDLRLVDEWYYLDRHKRDRQFVPSVLFVDTEGENLTTEIPEICDELTEYKYWSFHLNGKFASRINFSVYSEFFPYDLLFVTGHGTSPRCVEVVYGFQARDGQNHTMRFHEYFQIGRKRGDKYEVERKIYPLQADGIDWENKEALEKAGISHLFREFFIQEQADLTEVIESNQIDPRSIEGLLLYDGVFIGWINMFASQNNPIVILNTCGSLIEMRGLLEFAGTRTLIGTMWSVYDNDAYDFATAFFREIPNNSVANAFHKARSKVERICSRLSYVHFGTLNSYLPMKSEIDNETEVGKEMATRLVEASVEAAVRYLAGKMSSTIDLSDIMKLGHVSETFVDRKFPRDNQLRQQLQNAQRLIHPNQSDLQN